MHRRIFRLWPLFVFGVAGCDSEVLRTPATGTGGAPTGPVVSVEVLGRRAEHLEPLDVLVHRSSGELRSRHRSSPQGLEVEADAGDIVSVVWPSDVFEEIGTWRLESALVTEEATRIRFHVGGPPPVASTNPPIRLAVTQTAQPDVAYSIHADCLTPDGESRTAPFDIGGYVGCPHRPSSLVTSIGRDEDNRILTFDYAEVVHEPDATATITFASTPVERRNVDVTVSAEPGWRAALLDGQVWWTAPRRNHLELLDGMPVHEVELPTAVRFGLPVVPIGESTASIATVLETPEGAESCHHAFVTTTRSRTWRPTRLRRAAWAWDLATYRMLDPRDDGGFAEDGDAIVMTLDGARLWVPVPDGDEQRLPELQMPDDLPQTFGPVYLGRVAARHEDRFDEQGYAAYLARGIGETQHLRIPGEKVYSGHCESL